MVETEKKQWILEWNFLFSKHNESWFESCCKQHNCFLVDFCLHTLLNKVQVNASDSRLVHHCVTAICRITTIIKEKCYVVNEFYVIELLRMVLQYIDYSLNVVCYSCVNTLANLLCIHGSTCSTCKDNNKLECDWIMGIFQVLSEAKSLSTFRLKSISEIVHYVGAEKELLSNDFFLELYKRIGDPTLLNVISSLIIDDLCYLPQRSEFHLTHIKQALLDHCSSVRIAAKQRLLPALLKVARLRVWFMENLDALLDLPKFSPYTLNSKLVLTKFAIIHQKTASLSYGWYDYLDKSILVIALLSDSDETKLTAWELLCDHPKKSRPFADFELKLAYGFILCNCAEQSPQIRQRIYTNVEQLLLRIRDSAIHLIKANNISEIQVYKQLLVNLKRSSFYYLSQKSANFNRRISALSLVKILYCDGLLVSQNIDLRAYFEMEKWLNSDDIQSLLSCLDDEFQLCQEIALSILTTLRIDDHHENFAGFMANTKENLFTCNTANVSSNYHLRFLCVKFPEKVRSVLLELLNTCKKILTAASNDNNSLLQFTEHKPYVFLSAIEDILHICFQYRQFDAVWCLEELQEICYKFSEVVSPVCHNLSPEGYLPTECVASLGTDVEELVRLHINFAQKLLICCWRTHKCVSAIFGVIGSQASYPDEINLSALRKIGDYLWLQLTECRHRGAFESAAQAFETLCSRLWVLHRLPSNSTSPVVFPMYWLQKVMSALNGDSGTDNLCSTRRSAGLPHLVSVLLATAKVDKQFPHLDDTLRFLLGCRSLEPRLEVHCVNILKVLYSNSSLAEGVLMHAEQAFRICYEGCCSANWTVRNAHSQFFAAIIHRVFGIPKSVQRSLHVQNGNKMTSFNFFCRHPSMYCVIKEHMNGLTSKFVRRPDFGTFPILILLSHLRKSAVDLEMKFPLAPFVPGLLSLMANCSVQKMRELAAAALISICDEQELKNILLVFVRKLGSDNGLSLTNNLAEGLLHMISALVHQEMFNSTDGMEMLENSLIILEYLFKILDLSANSESDFILSTTLKLTQLIGSAELKQKMLSSICTFIDLQRDNHSAFRAWRCIFRPIGALFAEYSSPCNWRRISSVELNPASKISSITQKIRYEAYRSFVVNCHVLSSKSEKVILTDLLQDLDECDDEHNLQLVCRFCLNVICKHIHILEVKIVALLAREGQVLLKHGIRINNETLKKCESMRKRDENTLNVFRLKLAHSSQLKDDGMVEELNNFVSNVFTSSDDESIRLSALKLIEDFLDKLPSLKLLETACLALKDESSVIRCSASRFLSGHLVTLKNGYYQSAVSLNAEACWSFALEKFAMLPSRMHPSSDKCNGSYLFSASPHNIFAENFGTFDFHEIKELLDSTNI